MNGRRTLIGSRQQSLQGSVGQDLLPRPDPVARGERSGIGEEADQPFAGGGQRGARAKPPEELADALFPLQGSLGALGQRSGQKRDPMRRGQVDVELAGPATELDLGELVACDSRN